MIIGVLGLQGAVSEHVEMLRGSLARGEVRVVKRADEILDLDAVVIPGGESTTITDLMVKYGINEALLKRREMPMLGTCAGMIVLARGITGMEQYSLGLIDIRVLRNAFGRQRESFEADLEIPVLGKRPFRGVFIRAPAIEGWGKKVEVLARFEGTPVLAREGNKLASAFHPELTGDSRLHGYFVELVRDHLSKTE